MRCAGCGSYCIHPDFTMKRCEWCTKPPRTFQERQDAYAAAMDEKGADQIERENHEAGR